MMTHLILLLIIEAIYDVKIKTDFTRKRYGMGRSLKDVPFRGRPTPGWDYICA